MVFFRLSRKLGLSIGYDVCDYGLVIPHCGTIVVGNTNRLAHTQYCIPHLHYQYRQKDWQGLLLSTGAKITGGEILCDHIIIAASSIVAKSFPDGNALFVGCRL